MTDLLEFSPSAIIAMGVKRITPLVAKHGITSPEVFAACERWGGMLDEVNYPDSTCRWCGQPVQHAWENALLPEHVHLWYHKDTQSKFCRTHAGATAEPKPVDHDELVKSKVQVMRSNKPDLSKIPNREIYKDDFDKQRQENEREKNFDNSFKPPKSAIKKPAQVPAGKRIIRDNPQA